MELLNLVVEVLWVLLIPFGLWALASWVNQRRCIPDEHEWLGVMNCFDWKTPERLCEEMQKRKHTTSSFEHVVYDDLIDLEEEGLIESQPLQKQRKRFKAPVYVYRLKPVGTRRFHVTGNSFINLCSRNTVQG